MFLPRCPAASDPNLNSIVGYRPARHEESRPQIGPGGPLIADADDFGLNNLRSKNEISGPVQSLCQIRDDANS
ncbi:hypothetical protein FDECE_8410 [Fusarium decemcellulare]|nr:hypothetical protein FDECE_8410 [Fusarium decemcellulare]